MKREDESSLELLLDTMCNTFGGVMFIAITLAVVLFTRDAMETAQSPAERLNRRREDILAEINALKLALEQEQQRSRDMAKAQEVMEKDPRRKALKQLATLEKLVENERIGQELLERENGLLDSGILQLNSRVQALDAQRQTQETVLQALTTKIDEKKRIIESMTQEVQKMTPLNIMFTVLERHDERHSFFFLLKEGKLWRIGPTAQRDANNVLMPFPDVTYVVNGRQVICLPKPGAGVDVLAGDDLSPQCLRLLKDVPPARGALICLAKDDAEVFYKMRELMKKHGIFHGFAIQDTNEGMGYTIVEKAHYEY